MSSHKPLCIAHVDAETGFSGGEVQVFLLMEGLRARGYRNVLVSPPHSRAGDRARDRGFETQAVRMRGDLDIGAVVEMSRVLREIAPDIVHLHTGRATWLGGLAARAAELPAITTRRMDRRVSRSWRTRLVYGKLVSCAVAISPAVRECLERGGVEPARIIVVPSAIDPARIVPARGRDAVRAELGVSEETFVLLALASLVPRKGIDVLIEALGQVGARNDAGARSVDGAQRANTAAQRVDVVAPRAEVVAPRADVVTPRAEVVAWIAGDGPERADLEARAQRLGVRVAFLGRREDPGDLLAACDALVLPARREGLGVSALEAMAASRPVIASRVGGLAEAVVHERTGLLVPPDDARALAEAIHRLATDRDLARRLGAAGPARVAEGFLPEQMVSAYTEIYAGVLTGNSARMIRATNTLEFLRRASFARLFALAFVLIAVVHFRCLQDPPYWDALMGAFAQGHWLAVHSLSPIALLRDAGRFEDGGACVYAFSVYPWITAGFEQLGLAPTTTFFVLHVLSFAAAAAVVAELFRLVRDEAGPGLAGLLALSLLVQPMFRALSSQMNMDVLLAACTLFSIGALSREKYRTASAWSVAAFLTKPTAVILIVANLAALALRCVRPAWFGIERARESVTTRRRRIEGLVVHAALFSCFVLELVVAARFGKSAQGITFFGGLVPFLSGRLWTLPEFGLALALFLLLVPWIAMRVVRARASALEIDLALFLLAFVGFFCQYVNVLPRYFLQAWPVLLAALSLFALRVHAPRRAIAVVLFVFAAFAIVNSHGRFHPTRFADWNDPGTGQRLVSNDGWLLERSMEYRDDLLLDQELCARLQARAGQVVIADWPLLQALAVPDFGYVLAPPALASANTPIRFASVPIARVYEIEPGNKTVRVLSPNVYDTETSRVLPGDEVLETLESGRLRAFLVRRPRDSDSGRR